MRRSERLLATHDLDEAFSADHVLLMNGRVLAAGPPKQVLTHRNLEIVCGLGTLHEHPNGLLDDPAEAATPVAAATGRADGDRRLA